MILWSVDLVGGFKMPLPSQCPKEFSCIPEHFLDDAMDLLVLTSRIPKALESFALVSIAPFAMLYYLPDVSYMACFELVPIVLFFCNRMTFSISSLCSCQALLTLKILT
jgi:hypothetical protein